MRVRDFGIHMELPGPEEVSEKKGGGMHKDKRYKEKEEEKIFLPVEDRVEFDGKKVYQEDISMISAGLATRLTYRDAVKEGKQFIKDFPSACTINRRVGEWVKKTRELTLNRSITPLHIPDIHLLWGWFKPKQLF